MLRYLSKIHRLFKPFPFVPQHDQMDCGPACVAMIAKYYGKDYSIQYLREETFFSKDGVSLLGIMEGAKKIGIEAYGLKINMEQLEELPLPCLLFWENNHFVLLREIKKSIFSGQRKYKIADPGHGLISFNENEIEKYWLQSKSIGIAMVFEPQPQFYELEPQNSKGQNFSYISRLLKPFHGEIFKLFLGLLIGSLFSLAFPFLTQALIDEGIETKSLDIVFVILLAQVFLFLGTTAIDIIRNWILLYINSRINISIVSEYLLKLVGLPLKFFDSKQRGDFYQRIQDHNRIEEFLTSQSLIVIFSLFNFSVFFFVLLFYDYKILLVYSILTFLAIVWSLIFLKHREILDYSLFNQKGKNHQAIVELIDGMQEIKINNFEKFKVNHWKKIQIDLFKTNMKSLRIDQFQLNGFNFINQLKNILVVFIAAREVIFGNITVGALLSISYIIGQMNSPIDQLIAFVRSWQDARLSLERLNEVQQQENEEKETHLKVHFEKNDSPSNSIFLKNVGFQYEGPMSPWVLKDIDLCIQEGKTTAIVGASGSGKTTLMKLLLNFYPPIKGEIKLGNLEFDQISPKYWRSKCGVVMQDGFIFSDTIERNIATNDEEIDEEKLDQALITANIKKFVEALPLKGKTMIGAAGNGISGGQKQRILIARAVYKNPKYIFLDEATSALDTENEKIIQNKLRQFFTGKTVVIIAHRLSTVIHADQIIVLKEGTIVEKGNHTELVKQQGIYFNLIRNQLELGN